jgi:amino acid transporter
VAIVESNAEAMAKTLTWKGAFIIALSCPAGLFATVGYSVGALGAWAAALLWGISVTIAVLQNWLFSEMALMFPDKSGGIALYAHEAWKRYASLVSPIATFGYWFGWSISQALYAVTMGGLIQQQWFADSTWTFSDGLIDVGLGTLIAAGLVVLVFLLNVFGLRPAVYMSALTGGLLVLALLLFIVGPFITGDWHSEGLSFNLHGGWEGWQLTLVWLYIMGWSSYGVEQCASYGPEYKRPRDCSLALRSSGLFALVVFVLLPFTAPGVVGEQAVADNPGSFYVQALHEIIGGAATPAVICLLAALMLVMTAGAADSARALYGMARDGLTLKQLDHLNRERMPARAMVVDLVVNLALVFAFVSPVSILVAGNFGYFIAVFFAVSGFLLLRRDRPDWPRPIRLASPWLVVAGAISVLTAILAIVGVLNPSLTGYGGTKETVVGLAVLALSIVLYAYRRLVQDRRPWTWRERDAPLAPATPPFVVATADGQE